MQPRKQRSIDGFVRRPTQKVMARRPAMARAQKPEPPPPPKPATPARRVYAKPLPTSRPKKRLPSWLETSLIVILAIIAGMLAQSAVFGQLEIVAYGLAAFIWRIPSRTTFTIALVSMVATILLLVGQGDEVLTQNFATYTFLLLVVGVMSLGRELKKEGGRIYSIRQHNKP